MTAEDVASMSEVSPKKGSREDAIRSPEKIAFTGLRKFTRAAMNVDDEERVFLLDDVADEVLVQGFGEELVPLLKGLMERIGVRLKSG